MTRNTPQLARYRMGSLTHALPKLQKLQKFRFQPKNAAGIQVRLNAILTKTVLADQERNFCNFCNFCNRRPGVQVVLGDVAWSGNGAPGLLASLLSRMAPLTTQDAIESALRHHQAGRLHQAEQLYRQVLARQPDHIIATHNLGVIAHQTGRFDIAVGLFRRAIALNPNDAEAHNNLGSALKGCGPLDEAIASFRRGLALKPNSPEAHYKLGVSLQEKGELDGAVAAYRQAVALRPGFPEAVAGLGTALHGKGQLNEAADAYRQAIALKPDFPDAYFNLGTALKAQGQLDEAIAAYRQAVSLKQDFWEARCNLGVALKDRGQLDEAIDAYRQAIALDPSLSQVHSNLVNTLYFHPAYDARAIAEEHRNWARRHAEPLKPLIEVHGNDRSPDRRLRIGYVSPDFYEHPVGRFLLPLLENHDRRGFEVFAYSDVPAPFADAMTQRLGSHTDAWRGIAGLSDARAADLIRQDRIDILVDLSLHMARNRMLVFARKPAPVQVTYLAYAGSSGLSTMDYRLSDPYLDPFGDESAYSEQTIRLPETYWCYRPVVTLPLIEPPALGTGFITFGCLNNFCKVNEPLLDLWARLLGAVPGSRLTLHAREGSHRQRVLDYLQREGVEPRRVSFVGEAPAEAYFGSYQSIDIALDTAPYGGGTTTCDALWMGVPVVSLVGTTAVGRGGLSILSNVGLPELAATTPEEYVRIAMCLADDNARLKELRSTVRGRMEASPLMDAPRFARNIEAAYRLMWRRWC